VFKVDSENTIWMSASFHWYTA